MAFFKRLFTRKKAPVASGPSGVTMQPSLASQDETRKHMEAEVADDRERRGATDVRPGSDQPPPDA